MLEDTLSDAIAELKEEKVAALIEERLKNNVPAMEIIKSLQMGMVEVGNRFESGIYFLSELVLCGEIMKDSMDVLKPCIGGGNVENKGTIVIGTVKGDIHDLGKNIVIMLLESSEYKVLDLGVDVSKEKFVQALQETNAPLVGMSVLLTGCQESMKEAITAIREAELTAKVMIGGNYIDEAARDYVGADYFATMASDGVKIAAEVFGS